MRHFSIILGSLLIFLSSQGFAQGTWQALGDGFRYGHVQTLAISATGDVYAGGPFSTARGGGISGLARWDGERWHPLSEGLTGIGRRGPEVNAIAIGPDGSLYVGGRFTEAGGSPAMHIARWDGSTWDPLGNPFSDVNKSVDVMTFGPDGDLYIGGGIFRGDDFLVMRWNGTAWHRVGVGFPMPVAAITFDRNGTLYAASTMTVARYSGSDWETVFTPPGVPQSLLPMQDGRLYVGGHFLDEAVSDGVHLYEIGPNGISRVEPDVNYNILTLGHATDGAMLAGGFFTQAGDLDTRLLARWDGDQWRQVGPSDAQFDGHSVFEMTVAPDGALYVGGEFRHIGGLEVNNIARLETARVVPPPVLNSPQHWERGAFTQPAFNWAPVSSASSYDLQIARDHRFTDLVMDSTGVSGVSFEMPEALEDAGRYFWRVRARTPSSTTAWSPARVFFREED